MSKSFEDLNYIIPPRNYGQTIEVSYACDEHHIYERSFDRNDQTTTYARFEHPDSDAEFDPANGEPELGDPEPFTKCEVSTWVTVGSYVQTFPSDDHIVGACDVEVQIGQIGGTWFISTRDDSGGGDDADDTAYPSEAKARKAAEVLALESSEAEPGEEAIDYINRRLTEIAGTPDPNGEFCVYYETTLDDGGPRERYVSEEAAEAAAALANMDLEKNQHSQNLTCGFSARRFEDYAPSE